MVIILSATTATAMATYKQIENSDFVVLQNYFTDTENVKVSRFIDGKNTCYLSTSKGSSDMLTYNSISCVTNQSVNVTVQNTVPKK